MSVKLWRYKYIATQWPCPEWFHIPLRSDYNGLINIMNSLWLNSSEDWTWWKNYLRMPYAWCRSNNSNVTQQWTLWYYYESEFSDWWWMPFCIYFSDSMWVNSSGEVMWVSSAGYSIRPFYNEWIIPNWGWQVLYQWTGSAWIYWHKDLWLITASSNGTTWVTIADKNLWATTVYNSWDTLSEDNRLERIRKAYISGAFDLDEYNAEKKIVDDTINGEIIICSHLLEQ